MIKMKQIFDIFSKRQTRIKEKPKLKIKADYREKNSLVISEVISLGIEVDLMELKVADYIVNDVAIERKTVFDFISSMKNRRLVKQLEELQQYKNRLLIIEGIDEQDLYSDDFSKEKIGMHPNSVRGFLLSILLKYNVPIIFTKNYQDTARFISVLSKREPKEASLNVAKKTLGKKERMQFVIESFPGIGPKTAKKLLKKFKTVKNIINATPEKLQEVIGKKASPFRIVNEKY